MAASVTSSSNAIPGSSNRPLFKHLVEDGLKRWLPAPLYWRFRASRQGYFEVELQLVRYLCDKSKTSVDVGASNGAYTVHMLIHSAGCYAFEPRQLAAAHLLESLTHGPNPRLRVEAVALSDKSGDASLRVAVKAPGLSTIESANDVGEADAIETVTVPVRRLDDYIDQLGAVGFIKIDVEGHEEAVLRGARNILLRDRPAVLVEVEERHNSGSVRRVVRLLEESGYTGFYYRRGRLRSIETFDARSHQDVTRISETIGGESPYVNNFLFLPNDVPNRVRRLIDGTGAMDM